MPQSLRNLLDSIGLLGLARVWRKRLRDVRERFGQVPSAETRYLGRRFVYPDDSLIGRQIAAGGEWDSILRPIVSTLMVEERPTICEVGSNIGASLLQILAARPQARVIAFEPSTRFLPFFRRNLDGRGDIELHTTLLGRAAGEATLFNNASTASAARDSYHGHEPRRAETVRMETLDGVCAGRDPVDLLKVDTDGFDFEVLRGGEQVLRRHRPVLYFEFTPDFLDDPQADLEWLQGLGYRRFTCLSARGELVGTTEQPAEAVRWAHEDPSEYVDILACADGSREDRLRARLIDEGLLDRALAA